MANCSACGKYCEDDDIFCLNCGTLLVNYSDVHLKNIDYSLKGYEFLDNVFEEYRSACEKYSKITENFIKSVKVSADGINSVVENPNVKYKERILRYSNRLNELTEIFDGILDRLEKTVFDILVCSKIIWSIVVWEEQLKQAFSNDDDKLIDSLNSINLSVSEFKTSFSEITTLYPNETFEISKSNLMLRFKRFSVFHNSAVKELKLIKDNSLNNKYMDSEDTHNHFCIYCGARVEPDQNFCSECGKPIFRSQKQEPPKKQSSRYDLKIAELEEEYNSKQARAKELVEKQFDPGHMAYQRFNSSINKSNGLFDVQLSVAKKMAEMDVEKNPFVEKELEEKLRILQTFIDKMEDLINELVIHLSSNKKDNDDINNLFNDMDDLIDSVKNY